MVRCQWWALSNALTARSSVTLVGEADRKMLKAAIKHASGEDQVRHRTVSTDIVAKWASKIASLKDEIAAVMREEKEEKQVKMHYSNI